MMEQVDFVADTTTVSLFLCLGLLDTPLGSERRSRVEEIKSGCISN